MANKHLWDQVTDDLIQWITAESPWYVNAIKGGGQAPFSKQLSEEDKREYYRSQMFNPDGSPNDTGRQQVLQRIGIEQYIPLLSELEKEKRGMLDVEAPMSLEPPTDTGDEDVYA